MNLINNVEQKYPKELLENRSIIEGNVIGSLWKTPESYGDYFKEIKANEDFLTEDGQFYYGLGLEMYKLGYNSFDKTTVLGYIETNDIYKMGFIRRGGYEVINHLMEIVNSENIDTYIDELNKYNSILNLYDEGFNVTNEVEINVEGKMKKIIPIDLFKKMTSEEVTDWYEFRLMNVALNKSIGSVKIEELDIDDDFLEECNSGNMMGLPYNSLGEDINGKSIKGCPLLSYHTMGIHKGNIEIFAAFSGDGKTSYSVRNRVLPVLEQGEKYCIISNEQVSYEFKKTFLATILSNKLKYFKLTTQKIVLGNWTEKEWEYIREAQKYYREHYKGRIKFVKLFDYSISTAKKIIKKLSKEGYGYFLYDTFKSEDMSPSQGTVWGNLVENSKQLFQVASKENVAITITMQLAGHQQNVRYLTCQCLSNSKGVKEVVNTALLMRRLFSDEATGEKYDVKPYRVEKDQNDKNKKIPIEIDKEDLNEYRVVFIDKTRNGEDRKQILLRFNGAFNTWHELGYCTVENTVANRI